MKITKSQRSWIFYDVANSAFVLTLTATSPVFFRGLVDAAGVENVCNSFLVQLLFKENAINALAGNAQAFEAIKSSLYAINTTIAVLIVALMAPVIGAIADYEGKKKKLFSCFLFIGIGAALSLGFVNNYIAYLVLLIIARICYSSCNIFYDSMLIDVADDDEMDKISSYGYAWGYIGSCIPFIIGIFLILKLPFGLSIGSATQISFIISALWWLIFSFPLLINVKQRYSLPPVEHVVKTSFSRIFATMKKIAHNKRLLYYIIAYFCYIDGVYTIISMSTTYGAEVGLTAQSMIVALLITQIVAFPCAIISGKISDKFKTVDLLRFYIVMYIGICVYGFFLDSATDFWILCIVVGMAQGGIQSLSRSYYGHIIPKNESNEYYGFYDIFGKFADFFGPLILAICATIFGETRYGILALVILFVIGFILITKVGKLEDKE